MNMHAAWRERERKKDERRPSTIKVHKDKENVNEKKIEQYDAIKIFQVHCFSFRGEFREP